MDPFKRIERDWAKTSSAFALSQIDPVDPGFLIFILDYWTCAAGYDSGEEESSSATHPTVNLNLFVGRRWIFLHRKSFFCISNQYY